MSETVVIKKYANRRLYNTQTSAYVTLEDVRGMIAEGQDFLVCDARTGTDITRSVLTQIIFEMENSDGQLLPVAFLKRLIRFYDNKMRELLPPYLEASMESFIKNQEAMQRMMGNTVGEMFSLGALEEIGKQNVALFKRAMSVFTPFAPLAEEKQEEAKPTGKKRAGES